MDASMEISRFVSAVGSKKAKGNANQVKRLDRIY
jgi:hypothetical protein